MALNSINMLPDWVRKIRQIGETLDAEQSVLDELELIIDDIYRRLSLIHEELVNEKWLEDRLKEITDSESTVIADEKELLVKFFVDISERNNFDKNKVLDFLKKYVPAHLMYRLILVIKYKSLLEERMKLSILRRDLLFLDGKYKLDGTMRLNGVKYEEVLLE